jgi:hypothetical protein
MWYLKWLVLLLSASAIQAADACYPNRFAGSYAFQLAGQTSISGKSQPAASLGRITFDGNGNVAGTSSVKIAGFLLGNPVTGTYEVKPDCTATWQLQDDSGAFQHFSGRYTPDGIRVQFHQTDSGGMPPGIMIKTPDSCSSADLKKQYSFNVSGSTTPMNPSEVARTVSDKGVLDTTREGDFQVDSDCTVRFTLTLPDSPLLTMRGFLVNGGKEILAFQTDPGAMVSARLTGL